jgi:xanthine dehydrogenase YagS FAD-binding subunit
MEMFTFDRAKSVEQAVKAASLSPTAQQGATVRFVAGGTNLIDMMKLNVERPTAIVDVNGLPLDAITPTPEGGLKIGALARNADVAKHPVVLEKYAVLSQALLSGASPQLRNMATTGGNLLQRTRCVYFRDTAHACNKRDPGTGCSAIEGHNRMLAVLGTSKSCIATNPSDQNVALSVLEASIQIQGVKGQRSVSIHDFYLLPGETPHRETVLEPGDVITSVTLAPPAPGTTSLYLKLRDRAAYEFALASAAIVVRVEAGRVRYARVALGGVGTKPWRSFEAEKALNGQAADRVSFVRAADAALKDAHPQTENGFKIELSRRCLVRALTMSTQTAKTV